MRRTPQQDDLDHALNLATYVAAALVLAGVLALGWHHWPRAACLQGSACVQRP